MSDLGERFVSALEGAGFDFFAGVPCSLLKTVWQRLEKMPADKYVSAVREDSALGIAAGAYLGGKKPVVMMQNSGLGVSMNALSSLHLLYDVPVMVVASWRGEGSTGGIPEGSTGPKGFVDAPEHWGMGETIHGYFGLLKMPYVLLDPEGLEEQVAAMAHEMERTRKPVAIIVRKGLFEGSH